MRHNKKRRSRRFSAPEISLTPLIDTALTLLVIFMIAIPAVHNSIRVNLPKGSSREVVGKQDFVITLRKNGELFFNSFPVSEQNLKTVLSEAMARKGDLPVAVRADEATQYGKVVELVDRLKKSGVKYVAMSLRSANSSET